MPADTFSSTLGFLQMGTGNDNNSWGNNANSAVFQIFEDAIANALTSSVTGGTLDLSTNGPPNGASQVHYAALIFNGALASNQIVKVPNLTKWWWVQNATSGPFTLSIQTPTGSGSILAPGAITGGSAYTAGTYYNVPLTGGSGFGAKANITVSGGIVTAVVIIDGGDEYLATDTLSASAGNIGGTGSGFAIGPVTVGDLIPQNSGWQLVQCDGDGNIIVSPFNSQQIQMPDGSSSAPSYSDVNEPSSGWYRYGLNDWRLAIGGADVLQITGANAQTPNLFNPIGLSNPIIPSGTVLAYDGVSLPSGFLWRNGQTVLRASYPNLLAALRASFTGNVTSGSPIIASVTTDLRNLGLEGSALEGAGISGLTISSITQTSITMSGNATSGSGVPQSCLAYPWGNGDGLTTFSVGDGRGRTLAGRDNMGLPGSAAAGRLSLTSGVIATFGAITGGNGYVNGTYYSVPLLGGSGSGALADITVSGTAVTLVTLVSGGNNYLAGDSLTAANGNLGGSGLGFSIPVSTIVNSGVNGISLGASGGSQTNTILPANLPAVNFAGTVAIGAGQGAHAHGPPPGDSNYWGTGSGNVAFSGFPGNEFGAVGSTATETLPAMSGTATVGSGGSSAAMSITQPTSITNQIIKT